MTVGGKVVGATAVASGAGTGGLAQVKAKNGMDISNIGSAMGSGRASVKYSAADLGQL